MNLEKRISLFETYKVLSVYEPAGGNIANIELSAYSEVQERSILALVCDNGHLLFRYVNRKNKLPIIRQLCWFNCPEKKIKALSFDGSAIWLLVITQDATIYILPILSLLEPDAKVPKQWKSDNLTEIKLTGHRAPLTSVQWWQTHEGQHIAVIGSELGEISFINLMNKNEVGGTYIPTGIAALDILYDESHDTTYLLITGSNQQQWRLLLEEKKSNFFWPFSSDNDEPSFSASKGMPLVDKTSFTDEKDAEQRPHYLSKFESGTFLTPQCGSGRNLVSAYNSSASLLQVLEGDLDQMHLFSYNVPPDCENIILTDKLIFTTSKNVSASHQKNTLKIFSRKYSEFSSDLSKRKDNQNAELQTLTFNDEILALYKSSLNKHHVSKAFATATYQNIHSNPKQSPENGSSSSVLEPQETDIEKRKQDQGISDDIPDFEGCLIIQKDSVWECRLKTSPEDIFLSLTCSPSDLPLAEKLGVMLGLDLLKLYEIAADTQLCSGQFAQAVHLYQLSKCPQLKRVAHFMGYGFLSELIAYIQVLFSTKGVEIVSADKCHFANIALHCFVHQAKVQLQEKISITNAFKRFLRENSYYDEEVAAKLLAEQGLYDLAHYFAKVRGQQGLMVETLLSTQSIQSTVDEATCSMFSSSSYSKLLQHCDNESYMKSVTSFHLLQFLAAKPSFLNMHLQHLILLLPKMNIDLLRRVACLYDPSHKMAKLAFKSMLSSRENKRYWSLSSLATVSSEIFEANHKEEQATSEDVIKFFIFVLLMICHELNCPKFSTDFLPCDVEAKVEPSKSETRYYSEHSDFESSRVVLSCGHAHVAFIQDGVLYTWGKTENGRLGTENLGLECKQPSPVHTFLQLQVAVISVSCGALHTLAITDCGVFGWGSSRYGQLGAGEVQQTVQPIIIESLLNEDISRIECGQYHSLALTRDGRVYSFGWGIHGQLGHGNAEDINEPKLIAALKKIKIVSLAAGQGHSVVLGQNGNVYTFGCGMFGQLGTGSVLKQSYPQKVDIPDLICHIASGYFHVLACSRSNKLYIWGCNPQSLRVQAQNSRKARQHSNLLHQSSSNQMSSSIALGSSSQRLSHTNGAVQQSHIVPNRVNISPIPSFIKQMSCGSLHSAVLTESGEIYAWGRNSEGQVGNGGRKEQKIPTVIPYLKSSKVAHLACGADFTIAIDTNQRVFGWGQNDNCQIGQKPSSELSVKSTSGQVFTIRTNRRIITIARPTKQSILQPTEILIPSYDFKICDIESGSFENDFSVFKLFSRGSASMLQNVPELSKLDDPPYGPHALQAALKYFHRYCDFNMLLSHCLNFQNYQAAAKLCCLENIYDQALNYQLMALADHFGPDALNLSTVMSVITFYTRLIDSENIEANEKFLCCIINFWLKYSLPISSLETYLKENLQVFSHPLSLVIFSDKHAALDSSARSTFLQMLSTNFCLSIVYDLLKSIQDGVNCMDFLDELISLSDSSKVLNRIHASDALTAWDDSIPPDRLWMDMLRNMQNGVASLSSISLSATDVDSLSKALLSEKIYSQSYSIHSSVSKFSPGENDAVVFSCGHYHVMTAFHSNVLPLFKDSMSALSYSMPQTIKCMISDYHSNTISAACPKCVLAEINSDL